VSDYHSNIFYSDDDGGYIADIPDLDACSAFGNTAKEALGETNAVFPPEFRGPKRGAARDALLPLLPPPTLECRDPSLVLAEDALCHS
jgi:hypothetical protein